MKRRLRRKLWIGVAAIAVLAGVTAAAVMAAQPAAKHTHHHRSSPEHRKARMLTAAASYLGTTPAQLRSELQSGKSLADVANATSGKSAQGLIQALESADEHNAQAALASKLAARIAAKVDRPGGASTTMRAATSYLGLTTVQLRSDLRSGKSLAQVASSTSGKSQAGLVQAIVAARKATLAADVQAGVITQARESTALPKLVKHVTVRVQRTRHAAGARKHSKSKRSKSATG
jgi:hypothetical protein